MGTGQYYSASTTVVVGKVANIVCLRNHGRIFCFVPFGRRLQQTQNVLLPTIPRQIHRISKCCQYVVRTTITTRCGFPAWSMNGGVVRTCTIHAPRKWPLRRRITVAMEETRSTRWEGGANSTEFRECTRRLSRCVTAPRRKLRSVYAGRNRD